MQVSFRNIFTDLNGIDYSVIKAHGAYCLSMQSSLENLARVKKAYQSSICFKSQIKDNCFLPISLNQDPKQKLVTALFDYQDCGSLESFLNKAPAVLQYAIGKKLGLILRQLHSYPLSSEQKQKAIAHHNKFMEHLASYISALPHFKNDKYALEALSSRYDHFKSYKAVLKYGTLKAQKIMLTKDSSVLLLPSYGYGPGDLCEDFASLECHFSKNYPSVCQGAIDGYFNQKVPSKFWLHFALYCALYSLWKCALNVEQDPSLMAKMQEISNHIREDFDNFKRPIPVWYQDKALDNLRLKSLKLGL